MQPKYMAEIPDSSYGDYTHVVERNTAQIVL